VLIKTTRPDLLIGSIIYDSGETVEVDDATGRRLVEKGAAVRLLSVDPEASAAAAEVLETATVKPPQSKAARRA
jgi:hypothetical protein